MHFFYNVRERMADTRSFYAMIELVTMNEVRTEVALAKKSV